MDHISPSIDNKFILANILTDLFVVVADWPLLSVYYIIINFSTVSFFFACFKFFEAAGLYVDISTLSILLRFCNR